MLVFTEIENYLLWNDVNQTAKQYWSNKNEREELIKGAQRARNIIRKFRY